MALKIPKEETTAISTLRALNPPSMAKLIAALKAAPPISDPEEMAATISKKLPSIAKGRLVSMLTTVYNLYQIREFAGVDHEQFLEDLMDGIADIPGMNLTQDERDRFSSVFVKLLNIESLNTVAKALRLQRDGERLYCTAKILSDIRPVFASDPSDLPSGAVLVHTLKLGYHEGKTHREFHVVLDSHDLDDLEGVLLRARIKDKSLRDFLKATKLPSLDEA